MAEKSYKWISVDDCTQKIPHTKVCIWDGGNTFWAYLNHEIITDGVRKLDWDVVTPKGYGECTPTHWMKIEGPYIK